MSVRIIECGEADRERFNGFVSLFPTGDLLQSFEWGELKAKSQWKPIRLLAERDGTPVAAVSLLKRKLPKLNRCILYASRGPVVNMEDSEALNSLVNGMRTIGRRENAILIKIDPPIPIEDTASDSSLRLLGFQPVTGDGFGGTQPKCVMQLDLDKPLDELLASFKEKWRYNIRLAARKGVTVRDAVGEADLNRFYDVLEETAKRDHFLVRSRSYFHDMWHILSAGGYAKLVLAEFEGHAIAGALAFRFGDKAWYTYGASSNDSRNVMPNHLVQWTLIQWAHNEGCRWYDFRGVSPKKGGGDEHLEGLNRFKEGFRPRFLEYLGEYDLVLSPTWYWFWLVFRPRIQAVFKWFRRMCTTAAIPTGTSDL